MFERVKDLREDNDLTQNEISDYLKINRVVYSSYETGVRQIPSDILMKLALYYNTSVDYIMGLTDIKEPYPRI